MLWLATAIHATPNKYDHKLYAVDVDYIIDAPSAEEVMGRLFKLGVEHIRGLVPWKQ